MGLIDGLTDGNFFFFLYWKVQTVTRHDAWTEGGSTRARECVQRHNNGHDVDICMEVKSAGGKVRNPERGL